VTTTDVATDVPDVAPTDVATDDAGVAGREGGVRGFAQGIRARVRLDPIDLRQTWQVLAGSILIAAGIAAIVIGYVGAARTPYIEEQVPYLISGGLLGLGLMVVGAFFFWGHWLYRQYERNEYHQGRLLEAVRQLQGASGPGIGGEIAAGNGALVVTGKGSVVHDASCPVVAGKQGVRTVTAAEASESGYKACRICEPALNGAG